MIVLSAATGELGRLVVDQLLTRVPASDGALAVRDVHKAADLADRGVLMRLRGTAPSLGLIARDRLLSSAGHRWPPLDDRTLDRQPQIWLRDL